MGGGAGNLADSRGRQTACEARPTRVGNRFLIAILVLVIGAVTAGVHWPVLSAQAVLFDDLQYITHNAFIQNPGWASARRFLGEVVAPSTVEGYYQPMVMISLMVDCAMGGSPDNLRPFHRTSLALHVVNTVLVLLLLNRLFGQAWVAAIVGLLFGLHPLAVQPIGWVAERGILLAAFFGLGCIHCYVSFVRLREKAASPSFDQTLQRRGAARTRSWLIYALGLVLFSLALMSKPTVLFLPAGLLLMDFWPLRRLNARAVLEKLPLVAISGVFVLITFVSKSRYENADVAAGGSPLQVPLGICHNIVFYLAKMVWPVGLSSFYAKPDPISLRDPAVLAGVVGTVLLLVGLLISLRWTRALVTGWLFFFVLIFPTMTGIKSSIVIAADKYVYLPSVGLLLTLAWALSKAWPDEPPDSATAKSGPARSALSRVAVVLLAAGVALAAVEARLTRGYLRHWQGAEGYVGYMLDLAPNSWDLLTLMGSTLGSQGKWKEAAAYHERAIRVRPDFPTAHNNLGMSLVQLGRQTEAIAHYREALRLKPHFPDAQYNLATTLVMAGRLDEAVDQFAAMLKRRPDSVEVHNNLGSALTYLGRLDEALEHFSRAAKLNPNSAEILDNVGSTLVRLGRVDEGINYLQSALKRFPRHPGLLHSLGFAMMSKGRLGDAASCYEQALQIRPEANWHNDLGIVLSQMSRLDEAVSHFQEALRLEPGFTEASANLKEARALQGSASSPVP